MSAIHHLLLTHITSLFWPGSHDPEQSIAIQHKVCSHNKQTEALKRWNKHLDLWHQQLGHFIWVGPRSWAWFLFFKAPICILVGFDDIKMWALLLTGGNWGNRVWKQCLFLSYEFYMWQISSHMTPQRSSPDEGWKNSTIKISSIRIWLLLSLLLTLCGIR